MKKPFNPSFPRLASNYEYSPEDIVYVPVLTEDTFGLTSPLVCNIAYETEQGARTHFWFKSKELKAIVKKATVKRFLETHDWQGMNPFETLNKVEFLLKYREKYPNLVLKLEKKND